MLIEKVIEHLHGKLVGLEIFEQVYQLVEIMTDGDEKFAPYEYVGKGVYKKLKFSAVNGIAYFRKDGEVTGSDGNSAAVTGCENLISVSMPLKIVAFKNKERLPIDTAYSDDWLAEKIIQAVTVKNGALKKALNARSVSIGFTSYSTDSNSQWAQETNLFEQKDVNTKIAFAVVNVSVTINIEKECFNTMCGCYE